LSRFLERQPLAIRAERRWVLKVSADRQRFRLAAAVGTNLNHALAGCATAQQTSSTVEDCRPESNHLFHGELSIRNG